MAEGDSAAAPAVTYDLTQLLGGSERDFLVNSKGGQVNITEHLKGKTVGLYFSAHWCGPCRHFTPDLAEAYGEINAAEGGRFEVVFISSDNDESSFQDYLSEMPWLAVPFSDTAARERLDQQFEVAGIPHLVILKADPGTTSAEVINEDAVGVVSEYGAEAFPFSEERIQELQEAVKPVRTVTYDLGQLLSGSERDFLVNSKGGQVNITEHLKGKTVGLYFSGHWCGPCRRFTPDLAEAYGEINATEGGQFEVVFISSDNDESSFQDYLSEMPWLAVPFSDTAARKRLAQQFEVAGIPHLVILKADPGTTSAEVINEDAVGVVSEYGAEAFPFSEERIQELQEAVKPGQTVAGVLGSRTRDYLLNRAGEKVPLSEMEGKVVGILFYSADDDDCDGFLPVLAKAYEDLKKRGEPFEIVLLSVDTDKDEYDSAVAAAPCPLAVPFQDKSVKRLIEYFDIDEVPTLAILGPDGSTVHSNAVALVESLGADAYPFTSDKEELLKEAEQKRKEKQTLESILVHGELDYVVGKNGAKVPVRDLVGKTVLLYFSAHWCPPCRSFTPRLVEVYNELKAQDKPVEIVFASSDLDEESYNDYFGSMPWLALPWSDSRKKSLSKLFEVRGIPNLVALEPCGKTATLDARELVDEHGVAAFPFTAARLIELEAEADAEAQGWPERLKIEDHEHELAKTKRRGFVCDMCDEDGNGWAFYCRECDFDAHPKCTLKAAEEEAEAKMDVEEEGGDITALEGEKPSGYVCEDDICRRI